MRGWRIAAAVFAFVYVWDPLPSLLLFLPLPTELDFWNHRRRERRRGGRSRRRERQPTEQGGGGGGGLSGGLLYKPTVSSTEGEEESTMPRKLPLPPILKMRWQNGKEEGKGRTEEAAARWKSQWCQLQKDGGGGKGKVQFPGSSGQKREREGPFLLLLPHTLFLLFSEVGLHSRVRRPTDENPNRVIPNPPLPEY